MIFLVFYLGGFVATIVITYMAAFEISNSFKELWYATKLVIFTSLAWPIILPVAFYRLCFRDPKKDTNKDNRWRTYK